MTMVSFTAVGAFDHVGAILVVALMIAPPATAYLLTNSLWRMLALSAFFGVLSAISGYWLARWLDSNIAGAMATMTGFYFLLVLILAPEQGLLARSWQRQQRRQRFAVETLLVHLSRHEGTAEELSENSVSHLTSELNWEPRFAAMSVQRAQRQGLIERHNGHLKLTADGRVTVRQVMER
jgi:manganese/zinc/iron transport system permease protein